MSTCVDLWMCVDVYLISQIHKSILLAQSTKLEISPIAHTLIFNTSFSLFISKSCRSFPFILSRSRSKLQQEGSTSESKPFWTCRQCWKEQTRKSFTWLFLFSTNFDNNNYPSVLHMSRKIQINTNKSFESQISMGSSRWNAAGLYICSNLNRFLY